MYKISAANVIPYQTLHHANFEVFKLQLVKRMINGASFLVRFQTQIQTVDLMCKCTH